MASDKRFKWYLAVMSFMLFAILGLQLYGQFDDRARRIENAERLQNVMTCMLAEQNDHRVNNHQSLSEIFELIGETPPPPHPPPTLEDLPPADEACADFDPVMRDD